MNVERLIFVTWGNGYYGSAHQAWETLDVNKMMRIIGSRFGIDVMSMPVGELDKIKLKQSDCLIYTSAENDQLRSYIKDNIYIAAKKARIIPAFDHLMAHENKGFQQLFRRHLGFGDLKGEYLITHTEFDTLNFPYVAKKNTGAGSSGVKLISSKSDLNKFKEYFKLSLKRKLVNFFRSRKLKLKEYERYEYARRNFQPAVTQEYIPNLDGDYKILIFGEKFYSIKRLVREKDFRASGSGKFIFHEAPVDVLQYAKKIFEILNVPYVSLDIAYAEHGKCHLIEYQVLNFGPTTLTLSDGFFSEKNGEWIFIKESPDLEREFCNGIASFLIKNQLISH